LQEMVIYGVSFDMVGKQPIVLLKAVDTNKFLPIWIGHPEAAASRLGEAFGRALGADVKVTPRGTGYKVALTFDSFDEALELASRIGTAEPV
jgi:hypothetical protein